MRQAALSPPWTLWARLLMAMLWPFVATATTLVVLAVLLLALRMGELAPAAAFELGDLLPILMHGLPHLATLAVPVAWLVALLLALGQFSADGGYIAARAAGIGPLRLCAPLFVFGVALCVLLFTLSAYAAPKGNRAIRQEMLRLAKVGAVSGLRAGSFNDAWRDITIYLGRRDATGRLHDVLLADDRDPEIRLVAFAKSGRIAAAPGSHRIGVQLDSGELHSMSRDGRLFRRATFDSYAFEIDLAILLERRLAVLSAFDETPYVQLRETIEQLRRAGRLEVWRYELTYHRKLASSAAPLVFLLFALALGLGLGRSRAPRVRAALWATALVAIYYGLQRSGDALAIRLAAPIELCAWLPSVALMPIAIVLVWRLARGRR